MVFRESFRRSQWLGCLPNRHGSPVLGVLAWMKKGVFQKGPWRRSAPSGVLEGRISRQGAKTASRQGPPFNVARFVSRLIALEFSNCHGISSLFRSGRRSSGNMKSADKLESKRQGSSDSRAGDESPALIALRAALDQHTGARNAFDKLSPSHRREYLDWISQAKRDETQRRRIEATIRRLTDGKPGKERP